jgi:hypothetical protein
MAIAGLTIASTAQAYSSKSAIFDAPLNPDEQALYDKGATMEIYEPTEHSGHSISHITAVADNHGRHTRKVNNPQPVLSLVFGMEDAGPAREEGKSMAEFRYTPSNCCLTEGWDKYHDRLFTHAYVREGMDAFKAVAAK